MSGDDIPSNESALVISNHLSYSDFYLIHALASRRNMLGRCRYFAKKELKYVPILGWTLILMDMIMVTRNWMRDRSELKRVFDPIKTQKLPIWLVTYCEGTRYTPEKSTASQEFCKSRGKQPLDLVLYPRHKGFYTTLTQFRDSHVRHVYDFTLVYHNKTANQIQLPPTPVETHSSGDLSRHYKFHIHVRRFAIADIPDDEEAVTKWLEDRWIDKDRLLTDMKREWTSAASLGTVKSLTHNQ